ncbi:MAG: type II toxin-antitoxin system VapC family toxin [Planctomycetota bacterium]
MAAVIHLDTHVVAWLYAGRADLFPPSVRARLERDELAVSPMVLLELQYLYEAGKTNEPPALVVDALWRILEVRISTLSFERVVTASLAFDFTRDPFDRLITAQAAVAEVSLITKDRGIRAFYARAVWN